MCIRSTVLSSALAVIPLGFAFLTGFISYRYAGARKKVVGQSSIAVCVTPDLHNSDTAKKPFFPGNTYIEITCSH